LERIARLGRLVSWIATGPDWFSNGHTANGAPGRLKLPPAGSVLYKVYRPLRRDDFPFACEVGGEILFHPHDLGPACPLRKPLDELVGPFVLVASVGEYGLERAPALDRFEICGGGVFPTGDADYVLGSGHYSSRFAVEFGFLSHLAPLLFAPERARFSALFREPVSSKPLCRSSLRI
jgi:hypothetical protein